MTLSEDSPDQDDIYRRLRETFVANDKDLAVGHGRNYDAAKHRAWKELPDHVNLDRTEIITLTSEEGETEGTIVAYRYQNAVKPIWEWVKESLNPFSRSQGDDRPEIDQIILDGEKFEVDIEEAGDEYREPRMHGALVKANKYGKKYMKKIPDRASTCTYAHHKGKIRESASKASLGFEQEKVRRIAQIHQVIESQELPDWELVEGGVAVQRYQKPGTGNVEEVLETEDLRKALSYKNWETGQELEITYPNPEIGNYDYIDGDISEILVKGVNNGPELEVGEDGVKKVESIGGLRFSPQEPIYVISYSPTGEKEREKKSRDHAKAAEYALEIMSDSHLSTS
ncbi:MAG: hypothetical protein SVV03_01885 [Candidatus Nanohaloarchaea archaeon]|nr:hypothetical protein [Candidatus Nanohaloarchaea archaeon]